MTKPEDMTTTEVILRDKLKVLVSKRDNKQVSKDYHLEQMNIAHKKIIELNAEIKDINNSLNILYPEEN